MRPGPATTLLPASLFRRALRALSPCARVLANDSGEVLTVIVLATTVGTLLMGGSQMVASGLNDADIAVASQHMTRAAQDQRELFESSPQIQAKVSDADKKRLYARWDGMKKFAGHANWEQFKDSVWTSTDFMVDLGLTALAPQHKGKVLVEAAADFYDIKDGYDIWSADQENRTSAAPELFAYTQEMKAQIDGRASAETFALPLRRTAAENKIGDMQADLAQANAFQGEGRATTLAIRKSMADAIARSFTDLRSRGVDLSYMEQAEEGAYEEFMRRQLIATHPRELEKAAVGDIIADEQARAAFDRGDCDALLATVKTENGPVLIELTREKNGAIMSYPLTPAEPIARILKEGTGQQPAPEAPAAETPAEQPPAEAPAPADAGYQVFTDSIGFQYMSINERVSIAITVYDNGRVNALVGGNGYDWMVNGKFEGTLQPNGDIAVPGTVRVRGLPPNHMDVLEWTDVQMTLRGHVYDGKFVGELGGSEINVERTE